MLLLSIFLYAVLGYSLTLFFSLPPSPAQLCLHGHGWIVHRRRGLGWGQTFCLKTGIWEHTSWSVCWALSLSLSLSLSHSLTHAKKHTQITVYLVFICIKSNVRIVIAGSYFSCSLQHIRMSWLKNKSLGQLLWIMSSFTTPCNSLWDHGFQDVDRATARQAEGGRLVCPAHLCNAKTTLLLLAHDARQDAKRAPCSWRRRQQTTQANV